MSVYIFEEPDDIPYYSDNYPIFSEIQKKRYNEVLMQLNDTWNDTIEQMNFIHSIDIEKCNYIMNKLHKLFFMVYNYNIDYYNDDNINMRRYNNFRYSKLLKIKNSKYIL